MGISTRNGSWLNCPKDCLFDHLSELVLWTGSQTDFWRNTHYGFVRDNGHFWQLPAPEKFTATLTFEGDYETRYDQAGLMLRLDETRWVKCGIEHSDGMTNFSIVVTRGNSDWSVIGQPLISGPQTVRLTAQNDAIIAHFQTSDGAWNLMRVADFPMGGEAMIGPMACSPERSGFRARFLDLNITTPIENPLHG